MQYLLGIEINRINIGICLFEESGKMVSSVNYPIEINLTSSDYGELNPEIWWEKSVTGIQKVITESKIDSSDITVIGFSGFHNCPVFADESGKPIRTGITHPNKSFSELMIWIKENEPGVIEKARWVLTPKDYLRFQFTGQAHTDYSSATAMELLDVNTKKWSVEKSHKLNISHEQLPTLKAAHHVVGVITPEAAESTGLAMGTLVGAGGGVIESGLFGLGIVNSGEIVLFNKEQISLNIVLPKPITVDNKLWIITHHVVPDKWVLTILLNNLENELRGTYQRIQNIIQKEKIPVAKQIRIYSSNPLLSNQEKSISAVFGDTIKISKQENISAYGGALLSGVSGGVYLSLDDCLKQCVNKN